MKPQSLESLETNLKMGQGKTNLDTSSCDTATSATWIIPASRMKMQDSLKNTLSGDILDKMILHHISRVVSRIEYDHWLSPNQVALRRKKKKEEKQRKHFFL